MKTKKKNVKIKNIKGGGFLNKNMKKEISVSLLAGLICGIVSGVAFAFIDPKKIWLAVPIAGAMAIFSFFQTDKIRITEENYPTF